MIMVFRTLFFLFFAIFLVITKVSAYEFENENAKKPKALIHGNVQTPPLPVNKVYDDEKTNLQNFIDWIWNTIPKPKPETPPNPTPKVPQNPMPNVPPPSKKAPPPPPEKEGEDVGKTIKPAPYHQDFQPPPNFTPLRPRAISLNDCLSVACRNRPREHA
ncbi:hypothetical protein RchiOBHm_Chr2g0170461 [Rosa chinensis]|uniref:Uncharacterized protein n=1 Tax=Rosa chinensis TaxID=74649 RepID=A0A2P6S565_ROSCH|nr:mulatexin-like [Rosa chinensis]PRQ53799.1 hypothetical protein RchiOBHm_Chr2g0170461 [Rosa chinensis]